MLEQEIVKALKSRCYVSFVPNQPEPGFTRISVYRKGKLGVERMVKSVDDIALLAEALQSMNLEQETR